MQTKKIDALTSLRFFAAAVIVVFHTRSYYWDFGISRHFVLTQAVSLFYVLSGFILAYTNGNAGTRGRVWPFYVNRFARIWPLHIACAIVAYFLVDIDGGHTSVGDALLNATLTHAWIPNGESYFALNGVSWSLSVEAFFYAAFPVMVSAGGKYWRWNVVVSAMVTICILAIASKIPRDAAIWAAYILPATRLLEFALGIAAFKLFEQLSAGKLILGTAAFSSLEIASVFLCVSVMWLCAFESLAHLPIRRSLPVTIYLAECGNGLFFALLILVFAFQRGVLSRALQAKPMVYLGEISFAIYMVHQLVFRFMGQHMNYTREMSVSLRTVIYWCATIALSMAAHHLIEMPCKKLITSALRKSRDVREPRYDEAGTGA